MRNIRYKHNCGHYRILLLLMFCLYTINVMAQYDTINKHVIIAFDNSLPTNYRNVLKSKVRIKNALTSLLSDLKLQKGDYYSLVNFGINECATSISKLARPILDSKGKTIAWREYKSMDDMFSQGDWLNMVDTQGISEVSKGGSPFSLLTGAKAYSLTCLPKQNGRKMSNKTYLAMVTDDQYNGNNDQNTEFDQIPNTIMKKTEFLNNCYVVAQFYNIKYYGAVAIDSTMRPSYKAFLYEVVPSSSFSLGSVLDYPANLGLRRVKGGYRLRFVFKSVSDEYQLKRFKVSIVNHVGEKEIKTYDTDGVAEIFIPNSKILSDSLEVELQGWLLQNDEAYGGILLNPNDSHFSRLFVKQKIALKNEAKIYGLIPIPDSLWFFTDNWQTAVIVWDVIVLLMLIVVICFISYKLFNTITAYTPKNDKFEITKI